MVSTTHPMAVSGCSKQRHTRVFSPCVGQAVSCGGVVIFHKSCEVFHNSPFCTYPRRTMSKAPACVSEQWPCGTVKSTGNAFSEVRRSPFADDQAERAKATLHSRKVAIQEPKGGHAVHGLKNLSKRGQRLLAPVRASFCTPIEPAGSGIRRLAIQKASI